MLRIFNHTEHYNYERCQIIFFLNYTKQFYFLMLFYLLPSFNLKLNIFILTHGVFESCFCIL